MAMSTLTDEPSNRPQQLTLPADGITAAVIFDLKSRADVGVRKYKTTLEQNNHQNMLQHAYEEALDLAQYLKKQIITLNTIQDLVKQEPNDQVLGGKVRELYGNWKNS